MPEWFEEWFGEEYLQLYPHRDDDDARRAIDLVRRVVELRPGWRVLDVACGAGRHARAFERLGARCTGVDLSPSLLRRARQVTGAPLVRADMRRLPIRPRSMDVTVNLFTSFGYFASDAEHADTVREMVATVRPGGWFVLDFLNASRVRASLVAEEMVGSGVGSVRVTRWLSPDGCFVHKTIETPDGRRFEERVRLFAAEELEAMLRWAGVDVRARLGDYDGTDWTPAAPRTFLAGVVP